MVINPTPQNLAWMSAGVAGGILFISIIFYGGVRRAAIDKLRKDLEVKQDQFISIASHYMLSPITIIQAAVSQLQERDSELKPEQRLKLYDTIVRGQQRLWILAEQFLIVGEVDHNRLQLQIGVSDLSDTVSDAIASIDTFARQKNIKIHYVDQTQDVHQARFDARRLKQALIAILDNAIKFGPENSEVLVQVVYQSSIFTIFIQDQGIGMPKEVMEHVSERFYRGTQLYNFDYEGVGLGLHIAHAIILLHQGSLTFISKPHQGTIASIQLPSV